MADQCKSYVPGQICKDGFPMNYPASSACTGRICSSCGQPANATVPYCQREDIPERWLNADGSPRYFGVQERP